MSDPVTSALLAIAAVAALIALLALRRVGPLRRELVASQSELGALKATQAQVIHTTKLASLGQMVAGVAHEINTPLGFVKSNVEVVGDMLREHEARMIPLLTAIDLLVISDDATLGKARTALMRGRALMNGATGLGDAKELLADALEGLTSIASLVHNLKGFARVDRDGMDVTDLNDCVRSALAVAGHALREQIEVRTDFGTLPKLRCMPAQINQVILNLVNNAAQAMPNGGALGVVTRATGDGGVEVAISDTGSGIADDVMPRVFEPFFTTKGHGEGTGLGLSIVHKIVKGHGGSIHVRTAVGQGTTFTVSLPVEPRVPRVLDKAA